MDWLKTLAPLLGTALAGPLGGAAAGFIADKLGIEAKTVEAVTDALASGTLSADQVAQLKLAELEFQKFLKQNNIDLERVHAEDRGSARDMFKVTRSNMPAVLSVVVTLGFFGILLALMFGTVKLADSQALVLLLGSLSTGWGVVMAFWFGTTAGSKDKTEMLANSVPQRHPQ
jgi:hypothetical protein